MVQSGAASVPQITGTMQKQLLQLNSGSDITVTHNGYLYIWVSNESKGNVYFDDIRIEHQQGPLLEENHFYPYGLKMAALSSKAYGSLLNKFLYQGSYSEWDEETGYDEFTLRNYDPQLGRWTGVDPYDEFPSPYVGMGNDPVNNVDPDGGDISNAALGSLIGTAIGAALPYAVQGIGQIFDKDFHINNKGYLAAAGAFIGAGIGYGIGGEYDPAQAPFGANVRAFYTGLVPGHGGIEMYAHTGGSSWSSGAISPNLYSWIKIPPLGNLWEDFSEDFTKDGPDIIPVIAAMNPFGGTAPDYDPITQSLTRTVNIPAPPAGSRNMAVVNPYEGGLSMFGGGILGNEQTNSANVNGTVQNSGRIPLGNTAGPVRVTLNASPKDPRLFIAPSNAVHIFVESKYRRTGQQIKFLRKLFRIKIRRRVQVKNIPI